MYKGKEVDNTDGWMELIRLMERLEAEQAAVRYGEPAENITKNKYPAHRPIMTMHALTLTRCGRPEQRRKVRHYTAATGM